MRRVTFLALLPLGCAQESIPISGAAPIFEKSRSICEVMANPGAYLDQPVLIRGIYLAEYHQKVLFDTQCTRWEIGIRSSAPLSDDPQAKRVLLDATRTNRYARIPVVYYGTLQSSPLIANCEDPSCFTYTLESAQLRAARLPKNGENSGRIPGTQYLLGRTNEIVSSGDTMSFGDTVPGTQYLIPPPRS